MKKKELKKNNIKTQEYIKLLDHIKKDILQTQVKAAVCVTKELILLYWRIGKEISEKIKIQGWGTKVVEELAKDLESAFLGISGFSLRNLRYMRKFAEIYPDLNFATAVAKLPWGHNIVLMEKLKKNDQRLWYVKQSLENNWSRSVLSMWIESDLYKRQGKAITNFKTTLPSPNSDLAEQTLKSPYNFDFLTISKKAKEKEIEKGLIEHIQKFLLELGQGFAFVGRQVKINVEDQDYYIDLLFYHTKLYCYFVIELKAREFDPKDAGQIGFYISAVDGTIKGEKDNPTIGLLLCQTKRKLTIEYALRPISGPIAVANYEAKLTASLPKNLKGSLPTVEEIEKEFEKHEILNKKDKKPNKQDN